MPTEAKEMENGERLAKLESKMDNVEKLVTKIDNNFETFTNIYVPRTELKLMFDSRDKEITEIKEGMRDKADKSEIETVEKKIENTREDKRDWKRNLPAWGAVIVAIAALIITYL